MIAAHTIADLRRLIGAARASGRRIGFVPTMGFLHEGHLTLFDVARRHADYIATSIFVNPLQFGPAEDLSRYPRDLEHDAAVAGARGVDLLYAPRPGEMYPDGDAQIRVSAPKLAERLCGAYRPGHFAGVLTVVAKLFHQVQPAVAVFGQKDLQQATLIRRMVRDLDFDIEIVVAPIIREPDGLAMSSRNVHLSPEQRRAASVLSRALRAAQDAFSAGESAPAALCAVIAMTIAHEPDVRLQYADVVDVDTLATPARAQRGHALALAAFVGDTRLIDNHVLS
ncbi:MAG TPA: pantoate--beta-alanine ligase [Longimicrobiales bacterium]|nr:pantoate--beta-alanine ligase [Longimicrobiales bacterium]